jgi:hypothetical protein
VNRAEHIAWLEAAMDDALNTAKAWLDKANTKPAGNNGSRNVAAEMGEVRTWLNNAAQFDDMIQRLREYQNPPAIPSAPPRRRRELQLDENDHDE